MKKIDFKNVVKSTQNLLDKHSPVILTSIGITGMISTTIMAVRATPKAMILIEEKKDEVDDDNLTRREIVKTCWKCYAPAAITGGISIACLISANNVNNKRNAVLATAYKLSETTLTEYKNKVIDVIGAEKEQTIRDDIAKDRITKNPARSNEVIVMGKGSTLCYDNISGRYFKSDMDKIRKAENEINRKLMSDLYVSLNDFYDLIGLPFTQIGFELGWSFDGDLLTIEYGTTLSEDDEPCIVMDYSIQPKHNFQKLI